MDLKGALKKKLTGKELGMLPRAFDIIGSIAIIDIPKELLHREKTIANALLNQHSNVKTVLKKAGRVKGRLRTRKLQWIAGEKAKETEHRENGVRIKLNVETCYFSPRMSNDRLEIAGKVKKGENVLVLFSGVAPYALVIAKNSPAKHIVAVEINKIASKYAKENVHLNRMHNVEILQGDVNKVLPKLKNKKIKFDRIMMARPQLKDTFLQPALAVAKKNCIIHFHDFLMEEQIPDIAYEKIKSECKKAKRSCRILGWKRAGEIAPYKWRIRVDFIVS